MTVAAAANDHHGHLGHADDHHADTDNADDDHADVDNAGDDHADADYADPAGDRDYNWNDIAGS